MNKKEKISFVKGVIGGTVHPDSLIPPPGIFKQTEGNNYENIDTGEQIEFEVQEPTPFIYRTNYQTASGKPLLIQVETQGQAEAVRDIR